MLTGLSISYLSSNHFPIEFRSGMAEYLIPIPDLNSPSAQDCFRYFDLFIWPCQSSSRNVTYGKHAVALGRSLHTRSLVTFPTPQDARIRDWTLLYSVPGSHISSHGLTCVQNFAIDAPFCCKMKSWNSASIRKYGIVMRLGIEIERGFMDRPFILIYFHAKEHFRYIHGMRKNSHLNASQIWPRFCIGAESSGIFEIHCNTFEGRGSVVPSLLLSICRKHPCDMCQWNGAIASGPS